MTTCTNLLRTGVAALLLAAALPLMAHEGDMQHIPDDGATVQGTPEEIGIQFEGEMRITQFELIGPQGRVPLANSPGDEATEDYRVAPTDELQAGDYEVRWRGLAPDGHMMSDSFRFTVEH